MNLLHTWKNYFQSLATKKDAYKNMSSFSSYSIFEIEEYFSGKIKHAFVQKIDTTILAK